MANAQRKCVFENLFNKDYAGDVINGAKLKIASVDNPNVSTYNKNSGITYSAISGDEKELVINQQKSFAFDVEDIEQMQSAINLIESATLGAGFELAKTVDEYLAGLVETNAGVKTLTFDTSKCLESLANITEELDKANAPEGSRWCVVSPTVAKYITLELAGKLTNNNELLANGYIGSIFGLNLYKSNSTEKVLAGVKEGGTFALQINESESLRRESTFSTAVRGLAVYGGLITRPSMTLALELAEEE